jgi:hypothetical protein
MTHALARALARAVNEVVPEDVAVAAMPDGGIKIVAGEGVGWTEVQPYGWWDDEPARSPVEGFARAVLREVQNDTIEFSVRGGWPPADPARPDAPQRARDLPEPHAEVVDGELRCWFGRRDSPALVLPPIRLDCLGSV